MKRLLLIFSAITIFISCNDIKTSSVKDTDTQVKYGSGDILKQLDEAIAIARINNFKNSQAKPKNFAWASFNPLALAKIGSDSTVVSVKFFLAAFLDNESDPNKKNFPTIICQVIRQTGSLTPTPTYYEADTYCPPPYNDNCTLVAAQYVTSTPTAASDSVAHITDSTKLIKK